MKFKILTLVSIFCISACGPEVASELDSGLLPITVEDPCHGEPCIAAPPCIEVRDGGEIFKPEGAPCRGGTCDGAGVCK